MCGGMEGGGGGGGAGQYELAGADVWEFCLLTPGRVGKNGGNKNRRWQIKNAEEENRQFSCSHTSGARF